jgi:[acyl-carrier-protein] S-malonyltransferase
VTLALLCSGQGHQGPAMFDLFSGLAPARPILAMARDLLGGDQGDLHGNRVGQVLCVARGLAAAACLSLPPQYLIAGYSVGEMAAWGVAGCWSNAETLRLTVRRAELMDAAGGSDGGLGFIRGLGREQVAQLVAAHGCAIAIVNPGNLFIIGGAQEDVERCCITALALGAAHARAIAVRVASHTPLLTGAVAPFAQTLAEADWARPVAGRILLSASHATVVNGPRALDGLASQVAHCIDWAATLEALVERGASRMLELGPGTALAEMARGACPGLDIRALDEFHSIEGVSRWIERDAWF